jgi:hypothetical protein
MRKTETYFEQIPVKSVKAIVAHFPDSPEARQLSPIPQNVLRCTLCRQPVAVETAKTDGNGQAVHEECYTISVTGKTAGSGKRTGVQRDSLMLVRANERNQRGLHYRHAAQKPS